MFSKTLIRTLAFAALLSFAGCSLYEGPPAQKKDEFQQKNLGCMKDFRAKLIDYVDGRATPEDVKRLSACSITALQTFAEFTQGESRDRFTAQEVRNFLQRYFLEDVTISDSLLKEFMRVKQAFLGGKTGDFSREDLKSCEKMITAIRDILLRLQPSMPISIDRMERESPAYIEETGRALVDAAEILGNTITERKSTYSFEDMGRFFDEIMQTFAGSKRFLFTIRSNLKVAGILKEIAISPNRPREVVTAGDWQVIFLEGSRWVSTYFRFVNLRAQNSDWMHGEGRERFGSLIAEGLGHLDRMAARHCPPELVGKEKCLVLPGIPISLLRDLVGSIDWDGKILGVEFNKESIQKMLEPVITRAFGGELDNDAGRTSSRLTSEHIDRIRKLIQEWQDGSRFMEASYAHVLRSKTFSASASIPTPVLGGLNPEMILSEADSLTVPALNVAKSLLRTVNSTVAILDHESRGALFDGKNLSRPRVYREMDRYTWLRPAFKRIVLGYQTGPERVQRAKDYETNGLTLEEFTAFIRDYWPLLQDFKFVGPKNTPEGDAIKRFREASLFTYVSNGDKIISMDEGLQLVLYMLSVNPLSVEVHDRAEKVCKTGPLDDYGQPLIEPTCYREKIYNFSASNSDTAEFWKGFPVLVRFYDSLSSDRKAEFARYVEGASRKADLPPGTWIGSDDTQAMVMMFHYIEQVFMKFDENGDGILDRAESEKAFPSFENTLSEISGMSKTDDKLKSVFFYLLSHGAPPVDSGIGAWRRFWQGIGFYIWHKRAVDFKADRLSVLKVFATLSKPVASTDGGQKSK